jgi:hypothetical protein
MYPFRIYVAKCQRRRFATTDRHGIDLRNVGTVNRLQSIKKTILIPQNFFDGVLGFFALNLYRHPLQTLIRVSRQCTSSRALTFMTVP